MVCTWSPDIRCFRVSYHVKQIEVSILFELCYKFNQRIYLQYFFTRQHEASVGTVHQKESGIGNSLTDWVIN
jgi:oligoribonuclease (3'-5' exoribonuclease)